MTRRSRNEASSAYFKTVNKTLIAFLLERHLSDRQVRYLINELSDLLYTWKTYSVALLAKKIIQFFINISILFFTRYQFLSFHCFSSILVQTIATLVQVNNVNSLWRTVDIMFVVKINFQYRTLKDSIFYVFREYHPFCAKFRLIYAEIPKIKNCSICFFLKKNNRDFRIF